MFAFPAAQGRTAKAAADPFDKMLVAQVRAKDLTLISRDPEDAKTLQARVCRRILRVFARSGILDKDDRIGMGE